MTTKLLVMIVMSFTWLNAWSISLRASKIKPVWDGVLMKRKEYTDGVMKRLLEGVNTLSEAVKKTLNPKGRNVEPDKKFGELKITKDGKEIAKEIELGDPAEQMATQLANIIKLINTPNSKKDGDGTTIANATAIWAHVREELRRVAAGVVPMKLQRKVQKLATEIPKKIVPKFQFDEIGQVQVASVGSMDGDIGDIIADA